MLYIDLYRYNFSNVWQISHMKKTFSIWMEIVGFPYIQDNSSLEYQNLNLLPHDRGITNL